MSGEKEEEFTDIYIYIYIYFLIHPKLQLVLIY